MSKVVHDGWSEIVARIRVDDPNFNPDTLHACRLIRPELGLSIKEDDYYSEVSSRLREEEVLRVWPELKYEGLVPGDPLHPANSGRTFYLYWAMLQPVGPLHQLTLGDDRFGVKVTLITGTTFEYSATIDVGVDTTYLEFIHVLKGVMASTGGKPWQSIAPLIAWDVVLDPDLIRIYLCPAILGDFDMKLLKAVRSHQGNLLDNVLHRLVLYDWFGDTPVIDMIAGGVYQFIVTLGSKVLRPWDRFEGVYHWHLKRCVFEIGDPVSEITVDEMPVQIAGALSRSLRYDPEWIAQRTGYVMERSSFDEGVNMIAFTDVSVLLTSADKIFQCAEFFCKGNTKW
jgi:hypothetical protein